MIHFKVICVEAGSKHQQIVGEVGLLTTNETYGMFILENSDKCITFSTVKQVSDDGQRITVTTRNSTWVFDKYTN